MRRLLAAVILMNVFTAAVAEAWSCRYLGFIEGIIPDNIIGAHYTVKDGKLIGENLGLTV